MSDELQVDLERLSKRLAGLVPLYAREGRVMGKTAIRDGVLGELGCSVEAAERLVDTLVARGFLSFKEDPDRVVPDHWAFTVD